MRRANTQRERIEGKWNEGNIFNHVLNMARRMYLRDEE